jgi:hypothetical protein
MARSVFGFFLVGLFGFTASAQDAIPIKIAHPKAGQRARITIDETMTSKSIYTMQGMTQKKDEVTTKSFIYVDEIIANPTNAKRATKIKRTYQKAVLGKDGKAKSLSVEGKTVLIEKKGEKHSFTVNGQTVGADTLKLLQDELDKSASRDFRDAMFPTQPVKPGESWKVDVADLIKAIGEPGPIFDKDKLTATGTLVKAYKKDGKQFGVIEFNIATPVTGFGAKSPLKLYEGSMTLKLIRDGCIDGSAATGKATTKMSLTFSGSAMNIDVKSVVESTENRTTELLPNK